MVDQRVGEEFHRNIEWDDDLAEKLLALVTRVSVSPNSLLNTLHLTKS